MRYVSITTYAKMVGITRQSVYKRIEKGRAVLMPDCEVPIIDLEQSRGKIIKNNWLNKNNDQNQYRAPF